MQIAKQAKPCIHALVDAGALITNYSNEEVASRLLEYGLSDMGGIIFFDCQGRQRLLSRRNPLTTGNHSKSAKTIPGYYPNFTVCDPHESPIPKSKRFVFFDHIHTRGVDVRMPSDAVGVLTIGKDMDFGDFAQAAFRLRKLGFGQKCQVYIIPEVLNLFGGTPGEEESVVLSKLLRWLVLQQARKALEISRSLLRQNLENVWRKPVFFSLLDSLGLPKPQKPSSLHQKPRRKGSIFRRLTNWGKARNTAVDQKLDNPESPIDVFCLPVTSKVSKTIQSNTEPLVSWLKRMARRNLKHIDPMIINPGRKKAVDFDEWLSQRPANAQARHAWCQIREILDFARKYMSNPNQIVSPQDELGSIQVEEREQEILKLKPLFQPLHPQIDKFRNTESFADLPYTRSDNNPTPWHVSILTSTNPKKLLHVPLSRLCLPEPSLQNLTGANPKPRDQAYGGPVSLRFPPDVWGSANFCEDYKEKKRKSGKCNRLRTVHVYLEWHRNPVFRENSTDSKGEVSQGSSEGLGEMFDVLDMGEKGIWSSSDLQRFLKAASMPSRESDVSRILKRIHHFNDRYGQDVQRHGEGDKKGEQIGKETFIKGMASRKIVDADERGKVCVLLTLREAESFHRYLHSLPNSTPTLNLRLVESGMCLSGSGEGSIGFFQKERAELCMRFLNADPLLSREDIKKLRLILGDNPAHSLHRFFFSSLQRRRRPQNLDKSPIISPLFQSQVASMGKNGALGLLRTRVVAARICAELEKRGLGMVDGFREICVLGLGRLSMGELWAFTQALKIPHANSSDIANIFSLAAASNASTLSLGDFSRFFYEFFGRPLKFRGILNFSALGISGGLKGISDGERDLIRRIAGNVPKSLKNPSGSAGGRKKKQPNNKVLSRFFGSSR